MVFLLTHFPKCYIASFQVMNKRIKFSNHVKAGRRKLGPNALKKKGFYGMCWYVLCISTILACDDIRVLLFLSLLSEP